MNPFGVLQVVHLVRQDLSIAGKRAGLAGARSGLFMEQVRIVKEMRAEDKRNGRTGDMVRPRFLVWENVVGAFSSNRGRDFHAVLEEIARIAEPGFSLSGLPEKWKWTKAGAIDGDGWTIAWRTHDAKDWGKPSETAVQEMLSVWGPHSVAEESRLSQILEVNPLPKYNLTAKACLGILRRVERRGKDLPERLKQVLLMQSVSGGAVTEEEKAR